MTSLLLRYHRPLFYFTWFLLQLWQAALTPLGDDEAYYRVFAAYPDWGYFDHPPLTAALIRLSTLLGESAVAVRLPFVLLNVGTVALTERLTSPKNSVLFYTLALSAAVLQIAGFWAVPDTPLLFLTALLFVQYGGYLQRPSLLRALLLGVTAALLLYSKYHGVLLFLFIFLSRPKLALDPRILGAGVLAFLLFLPHLWWQYTHDWITFRYHLFESNISRYKPSYTLEYIGGQLLLAGPLAGFLLLPAAFRLRLRTPLERALRFTAAGIFLFFLLSSFKGKVEANWTAPALIPVIVLAHRWGTERPRWRKWVTGLMLATLVLTSVVRVAMVENVLPVRAVVKRFHGWSGWPGGLAAATGSLPAVWSNNYQRASQYRWTTGRTALSLNSWGDRRNNYNFWPVEDSLLGRTVAFMDIYNVDSFPNRLTTPLFEVGWEKVNHFYSFSRVAISPEERSYETGRGGELRITITVGMPPAHRRFLEGQPLLDPPVFAGFFSGRDRVAEVLLPPLRALLTGPRTLSVRPGLPPGEYRMLLGIGSSVGVVTQNSPPITVKVN